MNLTYELTNVDQLIFTFTFQYTLKRNTLGFLRRRVGNIRFLSLIEKRHLIKHIDLFAHVTQSAFYIVNVLS